MPNTYHKLDPELKARWLEALRSGRYAQTKSVLFRDGGSKPGMCCLGVLCDISNRGEWGPPDSAGARAYCLDEAPYSPDLEYSWHAHGNLIDYTTLPRKMMQELGFVPGNDVEPTLGKLIAMNDAGKCFADIADWIEENLLMSEPITVDEVGPDWHPDFRGQWYAQRGEGKYAFGPTPQEALQNLLDLEAGMNRQKGA